MRLNINFLPLSIFRLFTLFCDSFFFLKWLRRKDKRMIREKKKRKSSLTTTNRKHHLLPTDIISHFLRTKARENKIQSLFVVIIRSFSVLSHCRPNQICEHRLFSFFLLLSLSCFFYFSSSSSSSFPSRPITQLNVWDGSRSSGHTYVCISRKKSKQDRTDHHR